MGGVTPHCFVDEVAMVMITKVWARMEGRLLGETRERNKKSVKHQGKALIMFHNDTDQYRRLLHTTRRVSGGCS